MKTLVISNPCSLQQMLCHWFDIRGRDYSVFAPEQFGALGEQADEALIVDIATVSALQSGQEVFADDIRQQLLELAAKRDWPYLLVSDGRVYDADRAQMNHPETEDVRPGTREGIQFAEIEKTVSEQLEKHFILRTGPIFSELGDNFFTAFFERLVKGGEIALDTSLKICPTHAIDLSRVISAVIDQLSCDIDNWGVYHYNSSGQTSAYEFVEVMLAFASQQLDLGKKNTSLKASESGLVIEPSVPVLRCDKILHDFAIKQLPWRSYLPQPIKVLCEAYQ